MIRRTWITRVFAAAVAAVAVGSPAQAGLLPISVTITPEAGNFRWTYAIVLPTDMKLQSGQLLHHLRLQRVHARRGVGPGRVGRVGQQVRADAGPAGPGRRRRPVTT